MMTLHLSFIHSFIHSFLGSLIHPLLHSFIHFFISSFIHFFISSFIHSFIYSFIPSSLAVFIHSFLSSICWWDSFYHFDAKEKGINIDSQKNHKEYDEVITYLSDGRSNSVKSMEEKPSWDRNIFLPTLSMIFSSLPSCVSLSSSLWGHL